MFVQGWLCQRFPTGKIFSINVFFFGVMTFATIGAKNVGLPLTSRADQGQYSGLLACRFLLGMFEGREKTIFQGCR